jgi:hypothetical protein
LRSARRTIFLVTRWPSRVKKRTVYERPTVAPLRIVGPFSEVIEPPLTSAAAV